MNFHTPGTNTAPPRLVFNLPPAGNGAVIAREPVFYNSDAIAKARFGVFWQVEAVFAPRQILSVQPRQIPSVEIEFKKHERKWKRETRYTSSLTEKFLHPSYARIIGLGWPAVTHILRSLEREPNDWFYALRAITDANPVPSKDVGYVSKMTRAWLNWGRRRGVL